MHRSTAGGVRDRPRATRTPVAVADRMTDQLPYPEDDTPTRMAGFVDDDPDEYETPSAAPKSAPRRRSATQRRRRQRLLMAGRATAALCAVMALIATAVGWNYLRNTDKGFQHIAALDENSKDIVDAAGQTGDENFLIAGTDTRAGADGKLGAGTEADADGARSDTVMMIHIPADRSRVVAVSFPRDLDVSRPACDNWDNNKAQYSSVVAPAAEGQKLNSAYGVGGPKCLTKVIQKVTGLKITHFVGIDFSGFSSMVDTVGGVEVCTTHPLIDGILGPVLPKTGRQMINGPTALNYVRARHIKGEERSDYDRIHRQQLFLSSLLRGAMSSKVLFDIGKLNGFISAFSSHAFMDNVSTKDLLMLGRSLQKVAAGAITFLTLPTAGTNDAGNEIPRTADIKALFQAIIDDQPLPGEKKAPAPAKLAAAPAPPPQLKAVDPNTVSVQVSNGSGVTGVAATAANKLAGKGFQIGTVGNYSGGTIPVTTVRYSPGHEAEAATVASALPGAKFESAPDLGSTVEVAIGSGFSGSVGTPTPSGSPVAAPTGSGPSTPAALPADLEHVNAADASCK